MKVYYRKDWDNKGIQADYDVGTMHLHRLNSKQATIHIEGKQFYTDAKQAARITVTPREARALALMLLQAAEEMEQYERNRRAALEMVRMQEKQHDEDAKTSRELHELMGVRQ